MIELFDHNKEAYKKITESFKTQNKVAVIQPTGTGKSFLILKMIEDYQDENIIVLTASNAIKNQLYDYAVANHCDNIFKNVEVFTYTKFLYLDNRVIKKLEVDKIIIDEFHRTGAASWYKKVNVLLESHPDSKILGLSATPIRYLDNARNMVEEIFDGNIANTITLGEAVYKGILPTFKYITACYNHNDTDYILQNIKRIPDRKKRAEKLKQYKEFIHNIDKGNNMEKIFKENIKDSSSKFIVFCATIAHTKACAKHLKQWFDNIGMNTHIYISTSKDSDMDQQLEDFISDDSDNIKLLLSVNRFNEGLHVKDINGIIMMRPTQSPIMYLQQLGRALSSSSKETPLILDLVNNYSYIIPYMNKFSSKSSGNPFYDEYTEAIYADKNRGSLDINFDIFQQAKDYNELINELENKLWFSILDDRWNDKFEALKEFKELNGRFPKDNENYKDFKLAIWLGDQRNYYRRNQLSKERLDKLNSIDFLSTIYDDTWNNYFEALKEFKDINGRFPKINENYKDFKIGSWVQWQRAMKRDNNLSKEHLEKLESIDFIFNKTDDIWNKNLEALKEFKEKYNRLPSNAETFSNFKIGKWLSTQKMFYNKGCLSKEKIDKLISIDALYDKYERQWNITFEALKEFKDLNGRFPTGRENNELVKWVSTQKQRYRKGKLLNDRKEKLESLGVVFINTGTRENQWNDNFEALKEFKDLNGRFPIKNENNEVAVWLSNQKQRYKKGKLSNDRKEKLESLGVIFD